MIALEQFLSAVQENANRINAYELGHDGSDGKSDCIGLIIGALALCGVEWPGVHGSNWAARNAMEGLNYVDSAKDCFLGEIVYKAKEPGESGYSLPERYRNSGDLRDYYHVGVVTSVNPLEITHCTSVDGGIQRDGKMGKWRWGGKLKYVDYEEGGETMEEPLYAAAVTAPTGNTVRMRTGPSEKNRIIEEIPIGEKVEVLDVLDGWSKIQHNAVTGYMMSKFLEPENLIGEEHDPYISGTVTVDRATLKAARSALIMAVEAIDDVLEE